VICTVIGFPLGYTYTTVKAVEAANALEYGAGEIDMVINLGDVKNGDYDLVLNDIKTIKQICGKKLLKVIVETCYFSEEEKIHLCGIVTEAGADFIKTSTGFGTAGATIADVKLFRQHIGPNVKIKAAGGIKTREDLEAFIQAGADRIGTSSAIKLLSGGSTAGY
jgi:deoxyribose-phosphate aldolase